jgi:carbon starvation protein
MGLPLLALAVLGALALGYTLYGRFLARQFRIDDARTTPAVARPDGVDFVPTRRFYLLGQHFSAIAAAGPIAGPILACRDFGWAPCVLWITLGVIFIGAVHDFSALVASVRHQARSVAEVVRENLGPRAWRALLAFIWIALVYVIVAFTDITAQTLTDPRGDLPPGATFSAGGAVALAAVTYLLLALVMGALQRRFAPSLLLLTLVFVPATLGAVWLGTEASTLLVTSRGTWIVLILAYCFVASLTPVWLLLQPRGYLGGFVLYLALGVGVVGVLFGGFDIQAPAFKAGVELTGSTAALLPFLFVTIACGACSGFHGLVCSGTTSKQIMKESHCRPVGYGAMLLEAFVALIALATVMTVAPAAPGTPPVPPGRVYAEGLARFFTSFAGDGALVFATTFGAMAFSTFVFDTLDVATRLGRYLLEELLGMKGRAGALLATGLTAGVPLLVLLASDKDGYLTFWKLFGTSNQLLAGLTLLGVSVWLLRSGRRAWFTLAPMAFVLLITLWSLVVQGRAFSRAAFPAGGPVAWVPLVNLVVCGLLGVLAVFLLWEARRALRRPSAPPASA